MNINVDTSRLKQEQIDELVAKAKALFDDARAAIPNFNQLLLKAIDNSREYELQRLSTDKQMETRELYLINQIKEAIKAHLVTVDLAKMALEIVEQHTDARSWLDGATEDDEPTAYEALDEAIFQLFD